MSWVFKPFKWLGLAVLWLLKELYNDIFTALEHVWKVLYWIFIAAVAIKILSYFLGLF